MDSFVALFGPLHPPLTHFPIVCSILAFLCVLIFLATHKAWLQEAAVWLWILTFCSAFASALTGHF